MDRNVRMARRKAVGPSRIPPERRRESASTPAARDGSLGRVFILALIANPRGYAPDGEFGPHPSLPTDPPYGYSSGNICAYGLALGRRRACLASRAFRTSL